jgi:hypothetical protein
MFQKSSVSVTKQQLQGICCDLWHAMTSLLSWGNERQQHTLKMSKLRTEPGFSQELVPHNGMKERTWFNDVTSTAYYRDEPWKGLVTASYTSCLEVLRKTVLKLTWTTHLRSSNRTRGLKQDGWCFDRDLLCEIMWSATRWAGSEVKSLEIGDVGQLFLCSCHGRASRLCALCSWLTQRYQSANPTSGVVKSGDRVGPYVNLHLHALRTLPWLAAQAQTLSERRYTRVSNHMSRITFRWFASRAHSAFTLPSSLVLKRKLSTDLKNLLQMSVFHEYDNGWYKAMCPAESQPTFRRNISPPSSESKNKPNICWLSVDYTV